MLLYQTLAFTIHGKYKKIHTKILKLVSAICYQVFIFNGMIALQKL